MSETTTNDDDSIEFEPDNDVTEIAGVGSGIADELGDDVQTVADLASLQIEDAQERCQENEGIDENQVSKVCRLARQGIDGMSVASPELPDDVDDELGVGDDSDDTAAVESLSLDDVEAELEEEGVDDDASGDVVVAMVAGEGSLSKAKTEAKVSEGEFSAPGTVARRLFDAGLLDDSTGAPAFDTLRIVDNSVGSGAGRNWALLWAQYVSEETDFDVPDIEQVGIQTDESERNDWESADWAQAYEDRRNQLLGDADFLVVVENGTGVGRYINTANQQGCIIEAPELNTDDSDDSDDSETMDENESDSDDSDENSEEADEVLAEAVQESADQTDWSEAQEAEEEAAEDADE